MSAAVVKAARAALEAEVKATGAALRKFPRGATGLTPDSVKVTPEWRTAKAKYQEAFNNLRSFNEITLGKVGKPKR